MPTWLNVLLSALRTSTFWAVLAQAVISAMSVPVPEDVKLFGWLYIVLRVVSKMVQFIFPNPDNPDRGWLKKD